VLDAWRRSGLPAGDFAPLVGLSRHTLYAWKKRFDDQGPAGLADKPKGAPAGSKLPEVTRRTIIMLKEDHPDWGCQRISDMLTRGPALPASPSAVARVLHEEGYENAEEPAAPHEPKVHSFERARANQLWQTDLFTFVLKRQNRRVYLVAFMDDHSRFVVGYGLHASQSTALVLEVFRAAIASFGTPEELLTDNGSQYVTWRGKNAFAKECERRGGRGVGAQADGPAGECGRRARGGAAGGAGRGAGGGVAGGAGARGAGRAAAAAKRGGKKITAPVRPREGVPPVATGELEAVELSHVNEPVTHQALDYSPPSEVPGSGASNHDLVATRRARPRRSRRRRHNHDPRRCRRARLRERRRAECRARQLVARTGAHLAGAGRRWGAVARLLAVSARTLRRWRRAPTDPAPVPLGRPVRRSGRATREEVIRLLDEHGPGVGVPTLRACFPTMGRAELSELVRRYRRVWRARRRAPLRVLRWSGAGRVCGRSTSPDRSRPRWVMRGTSWRYATWPAAASCSGAPSRARRVERRVRLLKTCSRGTEHPWCSSATTARRSRAVRCAGCWRRAGWSPCTRRRAGRATTGRSRPGLGR
jgi:transposase